MMCALSAPNMPAMKAESISIQVLSSVLLTPTTRVASSLSAIARSAVPTWLRRMTT